MKRIVFSIFGDVTEDHQSVSAEKKEAFANHKETLKQLQSKYALDCGADYELFSNTSGNYNTIQFEKLYKLQELTEYYDEVLYLDFDVIPNTDQNFFEAHDMSKICCTAFTRSEVDTLKRARENFIHNRKNNTLDSMSLYIKGAQKIAMLMLEGIYNSQNFVINTGVVGISKKSIIDFKSHVPNMINLMDRAKEDSVYPEEIASLFSMNNEVFFTYYLERNNIIWHDIGLLWNFVLDHNISKFSPACHFIHQVNKNFEETLDVI